MNESEEVLFGYVPQTYWQKQVKVLFFDELPLVSPEELDEMERNFQ
jgi:hypothetical protein